MIKNFLKQNSDYFYLAFRIIIGILFLLHGLQKIPGVLQGSIPFFSLLGLAGIIETIAGPMIILGLFTRYVASLTAIEMAVALFTMHFPTGINPLYNNGEPALLFFAAFLVLIAYGSGKYSIDTWME